ncbi:tyrosine-type recombinase/integrase [Pandoraea sputorum]|uniref:tyrosine-type recombinase/integrase n=1 Tax=Pandoraea sputorum TaxID=93222 RepID=UPI002B2E1888|nr:tyrosine-type recombinase/integrase [Pandoraea sputorum]
MGRKPTKNLNLPPGMRARVQRSGKCYYYFDAGGKPRREIPLGPDFVSAVQKWAELEMAPPESVAPLITFRHAAQRYLREVLPLKAPQTQRGNLRELERLYQFFDNPPAPLSEIKPMNIRQYLQWRVDESKRLATAKGLAITVGAGQTRANRELALFSHIFNKAREWGMTDHANPCAGVSKYRERGRNTYVEDSAYDAVWRAGDEALRDAMDLAYLTGQRPADTLRFDEKNIRDGLLCIQQGKTGMRIRISIQGKLGEVLERIRSRRKRQATITSALVFDASGRRLTQRGLRTRFDAAREAAGIAKDAFQFRDLRAKAGTDKAEATGDIRKAQKQLGHRSLVMTEHYVRDRLGDKVEPTK